MWLVLLTLGTPVYSAQNWLQRSIGLRTCRRCQPVHKIMMTTANNVRIRQSSYLSAVETGRWLTLVASCWRKNALWPDDDRRPFNLCGGDESKWSPLGPCELFTEERASQFLDTIVKATGLLLTTRIPRSLFSDVLTTRSLNCCKVTMHCMVTIVRTHEHKCKQWSMDLHCKTVNWFYVVQLINCGFWRDPIQIEVSLFSYQSEQQLQQRHPQFHFRPRSILFWAVQPNSQQKERVQVRVVVWFRMK